MRSNYNPARYRTQSTSTRLYESQEAHGKTLEELEQVKKELALERRISDGLYFAIRSGDLESMKAACEVYRQPRPTDGE